MRILFALLASAALAPAAWAQTAPVTTASGLIYESITEGKGESPKASSTVKVLQGDPTERQGVRQLVQARHAH